MQTPNDQSAPPAAPALDGQTQQSFQDFTQAGANANPSTTIDDFQRGVNQATSIQDLINSAAAWQR
jgi:hypothetical protein